MTRFLSLLSLAVTAVVAAIPTAFALAPIPPAGPARILMVKLSEKETLELVRIDPVAQPDRGSFTMGSTAGQLATFKEKYRYAPGDETGHTCKLTRAYYVGRYEVTRGQFRAFVDDDGYRTEAETGDGGCGWNAAKKSVEKNKKYSWKSVGFAQNDDHPVVNVTWNDAVKFCKWATVKARKQAGNDKLEVRLPTEAEWEYACRGGSKTLYSFGDDEEDLAKYANVADSDFRAETGRDWGIKASDGYAFTAPVGKFKPNGFELYDTYGNVWEWCSDYYSENAYTTTDRCDPRGPAGGLNRVYRGGSCGGDPRDCRSAARGRYLPDYRERELGFRAAGTGGQ